MDLDTRQRAHRRSNHVHRVGAGLTGLVLVIFGVAGAMLRPPLFDTQGEVVAGLSTNGALSFLSAAIGSLLIGAAVLGGIFAANVCVVVGVVLVASGPVNLYLMSADLNVLAFSLPNVVLSLVVGLMVMTFGLYGRARGGVDGANPYRRHREGEHAAAAVPRPRTEGAGGSVADTPTRPFGGSRR